MKFSLNATSREAFRNFCFLRLPAAQCVWFLIVLILSLHATEMCKITKKNSACCKIETVVTSVFFNSSLACVVIILPPDFSVQVSGNVSEKQVVQLEPEQEVEGHPLGPASLALSPHQLWLASVCRDGLLRVRETASMVGTHFLDFVWPIFSFASSEHFHDAFIVVHMCTVVFTGDLRWAAMQFQLWWWTEWCVFFRGQPDNRRYWLSRRLTPLL